jgi:Retinal pigment epithelial membrane protein
MMACSCMHARHRYESLGLGSGAVNPPAEPTRYTIDPTAGTVTTTRLVAGYQLDFPVVPPHLTGRPARFCYSSGTRARERPDGPSGPEVTASLQKKVTQCASHGLWPARMAVACMHSRSPHGCMSASHACMHAPRPSAPAHACSHHRMPSHSLPVPMRPRSCTARSCS